MRILFFFKVDTLVNIGRKLNVPARTLVKAQMDRPILAPGTVQLARPSVKFNENQLKFKEKQQKSIENEGKSIEMNIK